LSAEVGGLTTLQGLRLLQEDEQTRVIVLISKPPAPAVAEKVLAAAAGGNKPVVVMFLSQHSQAKQYADNVVFAHTLSEAAHLAGELCTAGKVPGEPLHAHVASAG